MNTPTLHTLRLDIDGDAVRATLCRPERLNAVGAQLLDELVVPADWLGEREDLHYLVLDHEGPVFSAGANLEDFLKVPEKAEEKEDLPVMGSFALPEKWDESYDVVVVGGGFAGLAAAYSAEKAGSSICSCSAMVTAGLVSPPLRYRNRSSPQVRAKVSSRKQMNLINPERLWMNVSS